MIDTLRGHFPVTKQWAFLDHAAVAPLPDESANALTAYAASLSGHGIAAISQWTHRLKEVRQLAAHIINAPNVDDICFIPNTSFGIGLVAEGFPWNAGDNVVTAAEEFPSNLYPWMNRREVEVRTVPSRDSRIHLDDLRDAMDDRTRVLAISAVEFASGYRNDLAALGELCRSKSVFFFVDAIQILGMMPLDVQALGIDALAADSHKWLLGPEGAGFAYVRREWAERLRATMVGWNSVVNPFDFNTIDFRLKSHAGRWEGGAPNVAGLTAMGASLQLLHDCGLEAVWRSIASLTDYLCEQAPRAGLEVFSSREASEKSGIVSLAAPNRDVTWLVTRCRDAGVIVNNRRHRLRVSPHAYNTPGDIDRFLDAVK